MGDEEKMRMPPEEDREVLKQLQPLTEEEIEALWLDVGGEG